MKLSIVETAIRKVFGFACLLVLTFFLTVDIAEASENPAIDSRWYFEAGLSNSAFKLQGEELHETGLPLGWALGANLYISQNAYVVGRAGRSFFRFGDGTILSSSTSEPSGEMNVRAIEHDSVSFGAGAEVNLYNAAVFAEIRALHNSIDAIIHKYYDKVESISGFGSEVRVGGRIRSGDIFAQASAAYQYMTYDDTHAYATSYEGEVGLNINSQMSVSVKGVSSTHESSIGFVGLNASFYY